MRPVPDEARVIAIDGFCMPAGADRHVHAELGDTVVMLRRGVTAVRDLAWPPDRIFPLAEASELPGFHGPLIRAVGPMLTAPGGYPTKATWAPAGTGLEVADADEAAGAVAALGQRGATAIKVSLNARGGTHAERRRADGRCATPRTASTSPSRRTRRAPARWRGRWARASMNSPTRRGPSGSPTT